MFPDHLLSERIAHWLDYFPHCIHMIWLGLVLDFITGFVQYLYVEGLLD